MASATSTTAKVEAPEKALATPQSTEAALTSIPEDSLPVAATKSATEAPPSSPGAAEKTEADGDAPVTDIQKKMKRAERFNVPVKLSEQEKRSSRAERFGTGAGPHVPEALKKSEDLKKRARAERFGITPAKASTDDDAKKKARLARFGPASKPDSAPASKPDSAPASKPNSEEEEKRKARALRFSQSASSTKENANGKENTDTKEAVLSTPGDGQ